MVVFAIMVSTLLGMPNPLVSYREKGIYRSYKIYGLDLKAVLFIPVITTAIHIIIVSILIIVVSATIFNASMPENIISFIVAYFVILFAFLGLGTILGVCSPNNRVTVLFAQLIFIPSMMLGGIIIPIDMLSGNIQKITDIFPSTHSIHLLNTSILGDATGSILVLFCGGLLSFILAIYLFTWDTTNEKTCKKAIGVVALLPYIISIFIL